MAYIGQFPSPSALTSDQISDGVITAAKIADNVINAAKIADGTVVAAEIADGTITAVKIATDAVTTAKIQNGSVTSVKLGTIYTGNISDAGTMATQANTSVVITGGTSYGTALGVTAVSSSANVTTINFANSAVFTSTVTENTTITPTNFPSTQGVVLLKLTNGGSKTVSYAGNCGFVGNTAPSLTSSGVDFLIIQGNTTHYSVLTQLDVR